MFTHHSKSIGTDYTGSIAALATAVLGPAVWLAVSALNYTNFLVAGGYAIVSVTVAYILWLRASPIPIPSLIARKAVTK